jgi:acyl-CoA thioesterase
VLDLESLDTDLFRSMAAGEPGHRLFGGQVAAQALVAAERTTGEAAATHSLHAYFLPRAASSTGTGTLIATVVQEDLVHANRTSAAGPAPRVGTARQPESHR